jgi:ATP-dependent Clp protease ATP-binding subunit ClpC
MQPSQTPGNGDNYNRLADNLAKFVRIIEQLATQDEFRSALANTPEDITANRTYAQIAMDDAMQAYETIAADIISKAPGDRAVLPVDLYKQMMEMRLARSVTEEEATTACGAGVQQRLAAETPPPRPTFLSMLEGRVEAPHIIKLNAVWNNVVLRVRDLLENQIKLSSAAPVFNKEAVPVITPADPVPVAPKGGLRRIGEAEAPAAGLRPVPSGDNEGGKNLPAVSSYNQTLQALLRKYGGEDFTDAAKRKVAEPVFGRKEEIRSITDILLQKDNPIALMQGLPCIGTTSVVQALAQSIAEGNVPARLKDASVISLKLADIITECTPGLRTGGKEPQDVLKAILKEVTDHNRSALNKIVLHIEDLDSDTQQGNPYIKQFVPMMRTIIAQAIEKSKGSLLLAMEASQNALPEIEKNDPIILKRCTKMSIKEMSAPDVMDFMKHRAASVATHNGIAAPDDALLEYIIDKTNRLLPAERQPVKSGKVLAMMAAHAEGAGKKTLTVDDADAVLAHLSGLPLELVSHGLGGRILSLETELPKRILGQPQIMKIVDKLINANAGMNDPKLPMGSFLMPGATGSGKTETARVISELLGIPLIRIDMSNFQDSFAKSKLLGAPPGYIGYDKEAEFEKVRRAPYCVLLLDEIEKAHPDVFNILLAGMEEGEIQLLNSGEPVRMQNVILMMTSNIGAKAAQDAVQQKRMGFGNKAPSAEEDNRRRGDATHAAIKRGFAPEFINRLDDIVEFQNLTDPEIVKGIAKLQVEKVSTFLRRSHKNLKIELSPEALDQLVKIGYDPEYNARPMRRAAKDNITSPLSKWLIKNGKSITEPSVFYIKSLGDVFDYEVRPQLPPPSPLRPSLPAPSL